MDHNQEHEQEQVHENEHGQGPEEQTPDEIAPSPPGGEQHEGEITGVSSLSAIM